MSSTGEGAGGGKISRRGFLGRLAAAGAGTALAGTALAKPPALQGAAGSAEGASAAGGHQWCMVIDLRRCDGCKVCTDACQEAHYLSEDQEWIRVYEMEGPGGAYFMPRLCMLCENPPCVRVCPVAATYKNASGVVLVDQNICIGCRSCMAACPYEARYFNWSRPPAAPKLLQSAMPEFPVPQQQGTVGKCILCVHNIEMGKLPACVDACTMEALYVGDLAADLATNGKETVKLSTFLRDNDAVRYGEELRTRPRVYYILGHAQNLDF